MLTINEINEISFGKAGFSGYKPQDVDDFIDEVIETVQHLLNEKEADAGKIAELQSKLASNQQKLTILAEKVESYRNDESGISDAILSAQKISRDTIRQAKDKAEIILEDATVSAGKIMDSAKAESSMLAEKYASKVEEKKKELEEMKKQVSAFKVSLLEMYKKHLDAVNHIPSFRQKKTDDDVLPSSSTQRVCEAEKVMKSEVVEKAEKAKAVECKSKHECTKKQTTLEDKIDYSEQQLKEVSEDTSDNISFNTNEIADTYTDDLKDVGIDLNAYADIPESLKEQKRSRFSNLEFGDGVDVSSRRP